MWELPYAENLAFYRNNVSKFKTWPKKASCFIKYWTNFSKENKTYNSDNFSKGTMQESDRITSQVLIWQIL